MANGQLTNKGDVANYISSLRNKDRNKGTEAEVSPRISSLNQQLARGLREQCAHDAVIPHGLRSQRRPHHARDRSIAKVPGRCTEADACTAPSRVVACRGSADPWPSSDLDR